MPSVERGGRVRRAAGVDVRLATGVRIADDALAAAPLRATGDIASHAAARSRVHAPHSPQRFGDRMTPMREPLQCRPCHLLAAASFIDVQGNRS
jgi:hypothetical protein